MGKGSESEIIFKFPAFSHLGKYFDLEYPRKYYICELKNKISFFETRYIRLFMQKIVSYFLFFILLATPVLRCDNIKLNASNSEVPHNIYKPSTLEINHSSDIIQLPKQGQTVALSKVELKRVNQKWYEWNPDYNNFNFITDIQLLKKYSDELAQLSEKLGFKVQNPKHIDLYREAVNWLGTRYRWAGNSKKGVDCSGLTNILLKEVYNIKVERRSSSIAKNIKEELTENNAEPGDLVFFSTRNKTRIDHVGIYLGDRYFIHASTKQGVIVSSLDEQYYTRTLKKIGRI